MRVTALELAAAARAGDQSGRDGALAALHVAAKAAAVEMRSALLAWAQDNWNEGATMLLARARDDQRTMSEVIKAAERLRVAPSPLPDTVTPAPDDRAPTPDELIAAGLARLAGVSMD